MPDRRITQLRQSSSYTRKASDSLLGLLLLLVTGLLRLLLVLLVALGQVDVLEVLELLNEEGSHDSVSDLGGSENAAVSTGDGSLGRSELSELSGSSLLDALHVDSLGVLSDLVQSKSATYPS